MGFGKRMLLLNDNAESRYRDDRGRWHRENGEYAVQNRMGGGMNTDYGGMMGMDDMESRRRRDSRGRFRSDMDNDSMEMGGYGRSVMGGEEMWMGGYPNRPFPVYREETNIRSDGNRMNPIGFVAGGSEVNTDYRMNATHHTGNEFEGRKSAVMGGGYHSDMSVPMTEEMAMEWTSGMKNEDGTKGPHWKMDQVKQAMKQKGVSCDPLEMYVVMNALYSDYCAVMKKHGVNTVDIYVDLACAWLNDKDAVKNKASAYYEHIVKK